MPHATYNILVPVDFSASSQWAVKKAAALAVQLRATIHLVQILPTRGPSLLSMESPGLPAAAWTEEASENLSRLREICTEHQINADRVQLSVMEGGFKQQLAVCLQNTDADLLVIGIPEHQLLRRIIARNTLRRISTNYQIPVIGVGAESAAPIRKIVLPLGEKLSVRSIKLATYMAKACKSTLYIVALRPVGGLISESMNLTREIIKSISTVPVQYYFLDGKNLAESSVRFARRIHADLLMINPVKGFSLPGLWNRITNKILSCSQVPVIMVK